MCVLCRAYTFNVYICKEQTLKPITMTNPIATLSKEAQLELALKMVILDAIEKGHIEKAELINYMNSQVCANAVASYLNTINA